MRRRPASILLVPLLVLSACGIQSSGSVAGVPSAAAISSAAAVPSASAGTPAPTPALPGATFEFEDDVVATIVQDRLEVPWDLDFLPDGRMIVTERPGRVRVYASGEPSAEELSQLAIPDVYAEGEAGTMGVAVDVDFENHPYAYVCTSIDADGPDGPDRWRNEVFRFEVNDDGTLTQDPEPIVTGMIAHKNHNGCAVEMDAEGHLWISTGDASTVRSTQLSQVPTSLNGKLLRINRDGSIPEDNPSINGAAPTAVWSMGHRNPQGIAMREDGLILMTEHGTDRDDEINKIVPGGNYGYGCWTGRDELGPAQEQEGRAKDMCREASEYLPPSWDSGMPTIATSGARFLEDPSWGNWEGFLFVATLKESDLRLFEVLEDGDRVEERGLLLDEAFGRLRAVVLAPDGSVYVTTGKGVSDKVLRLTRSGA